MGLGVAEREQIAKRAAAEIKQGMIVNLGIGIPSLVPNFLKPDMQVMFQAENGVLGIGESPEKGDEDAHLLLQAAGAGTHLDRAGPFPRQGHQDALEDTLAFEAPEQRWPLGAGGEVGFHHQEQAGAAGQRDQAHQQRHVPAMPDGKAIDRRGFAEHGFDGRVQERSDGERRDDADDEAG